MTPNTPLSDDELGAMLGQSVRSKVDDVPTITPAFDGVERRARQITNRRRTAAGLAAGHVAIRWARSGTGSPVLHGWSTAMGVLALTIFFVMSSFTAKRSVISRSYFLDQTWMPLSASISCAVTLSLTPSRWTLPSSTYRTPNSSATC